jgi:thioredoxin 1
MIVPRLFRPALLALTILLATAQARPTGREIYPPPAQAKADLEAALKAAPAAHKRILLDFGGNWCADCQVLDRYFHAKENEAILNASFILVHVNIGYMDQNMDIAARYEVPLDKGVPALAVLTSNGKLLYAQKQGQFESMRRLNPAEVTKFLAQWKPVKPDCSVVEVTC